MYSLYRLDPLRVSAQLSFALASAICVHSFAVVLKNTAAVSASSNVRSEHNTALVSDLLRRGLLWFSGVGHFNVSSGFVIAVGTAQRYAHKLPSARVARSDSTACLITASNSSWVLMTIQTPESDTYLLNPRVSASFADFSILFISTSQRLNA
jgi:hypothetical protein